MLFKDPYILFELHKASNNTAKIVLRSQSYNMDTD